MPPQSFRIDFDTGSSDLWVPDTSCGGRKSHLTKEECNEWALFNSTASSTYVSDGRSFGIEYADGSYSIGFLGQDTVMLAPAGTDDGLIIPNQTFAQVYDMDGGDVWWETSFDGVLGLGFQQLSESNVVPPFINAVNQGLVKESYFTVYMESAGNNVDDAPAGGIFTFGGLDTVNCGELIEWVPLNDQRFGFWQFSIDSVSVGKKKVTNYASNAISDTGTSLIIGARKLVKKIAKQVGATYSGDVYLVDCNATYDPITFTVNGRAYNVTSKVLNMDFDSDHMDGMKMGDNKCVFGIVPMDMDDFGFDWVLGDPWIRQFCNSYDVVKAQIAFAPSLTTANDSDE